MRHDLGAVAPGTFQKFRADVDKGAYPEDKHRVPMADAELAAFVKGFG